MAADGLLDITSKSGFQETITRLKEGIASRGLTLFAVIDHAKGAEEAGLVLRPTTVLIFGNAKGGTPLVQANQTVGHRPAATSPGLGGWQRPDLDLLQRSCLACSEACSSRPGGEGGGDVAPGS